MKIVKNTMTKPIEVECPNCKSILAYTYDDIHRCSIYNFLGYETGVKQYIVCPVCKCDIDRTKYTYYDWKSAEVKKNE